MTVKILKVPAYCPSVGAVCVDKIAHVFDIPDLVMSKLPAIFASDDLKGLRRKIGRYEHSYRLPGSEAYMNDSSDRTTILFQAQPHLGSGIKHYCRVEYNPAKVPPAYMAEMLESIFGIEYQSVLSGVITRIDLAVDIKGAQIEQLVFRAHKYSVNKGEFGRKRTVYLGGAFSNHPFRAYDKAAEQKKLNKKTTNPLLKEKVEKQVVTRIEVSDKSGLKASDLPAMQNLFKKLAVSYVGDLKVAVDNDMKKLALRLARMQGDTYPVLMGLSKDTKAELKAFFDEACCAWWDPAKLWESYPAAIQPILNPFGPQNLQLIAA